MKILSNKKVYQCEHCRKISINPGAITNHEKSCHKNPKNIPQCWNTCVHFCDYDQKHEVIKSFGGGYDSYGGFMSPYEVCGHVRIRYCEALKCNLFTPLVGNWKREKLLEEGWKQMPSIVEQCKHFKQPDNNIRLPWDD